MIRRLMTGVSLAAMTLAAHAAIKPAHAAPHTFIVGLGETCVPPTAALSEQLMQLFVNGLNPGDSLIVYDAPKRIVIAAVTLPDREAFRRPEVRIRKFGGELVKIRRFLEARCRTEAAGTGDTLFFPQFLDEVARDRTQAFPRGSVSLLVVGSALYNDPGDPGISMLDGHYPSDSHLNAAPGASVFSTADKREALAGVDVHSCFTDKSWFSDTDEQAVLRWWSLYVGSQHGLLATFTGDMAACLDRFGHSITAGASVFKAEAGETELKMLVAQRAPVIRQTVAPALAQAAPAPGPVENHDVSVATPPAGATFLDPQATISHEAPQTLRGLAKIGIRWNCPVDLDIYARGSSQSQFLYYGNTDTGEGHFPHDYTNAPGGTAFEYVEFTQPVDLSTVEAFVNFYGGTCSTGPSGVVRLWFDNRIYEGRFALAAREGNQGKQLSGMTGPDWTEIDVKSLLHMAARGQDAKQ
jgi:hypothetical protein